MKFNLPANIPTSHLFALPEIRKMNKILMIMLLIGIGTVAITPTPAFAKAGDLYLNKDGGCDKGDSMGSQGWCVESMAIIAPAAGGRPSAESTAKQVGSGPVAPKSTRVYPKPGSPVSRPPKPIP